jgi:hypothetical protein
MVPPRGADAVAHPRSDSAKVDIRIERNMNIILAHPAGHERVEEPEFTRALICAK